MPCGGGRCGTAGGSMRPATYSASRKRISHSSSADLLTSSTSTSTTGREVPATPPNARLPSVGGVLLLVLLLLLLTGETEEVVNIRDSAHSSHRTWAPCSYRLCTSAARWQR